MNRLFGAALILQFALWVAAALALSGCGTPPPLTKGPEVHPPFGWVLQCAREPDAAGCPDE